MTIKIQNENENASIRKRLLDFIPLIKQNDKLTNIDIVYIMYVMLCDFNWIIVSIVKNRSAVKSIQFELHAPFDKAQPASTLFYII